MSAIFTLSMFVRQSALFYEILVKYTYSALCFITMFVRQSVLFYEILVKHTYTALSFIPVSDVHNYSIVNTYLYNLCNLYNEIFS